MAWGPPDGLHAWTTPLVGSIAHWSRRKPLAHLTAPDCATLVDTDKEGGASRGVRPNEGDDFSIDADPR